jgi:hypothetical protein
MSSILKTLGALVALVVMVTTIGAATTKMVPMEVLTEPTYFSNNGELHLDCQTLFYEGGKSVGEQQLFGMENKTIVGAVKTQHIEPTELTYSRVNGKTTVQGGEPRALERFEGQSHNGMDQVQVTNDSVTVFVARESTTYFEGLSLHSDGKNMQGFGITWMIGPDEIGYAFVLPQYVDYVLDEFVVGGPHDATFQG